MIEHAVPTPSVMSSKLLEKKLEEIYAVTAMHYSNNQNVGVLSGLSGIALFPFYYSKYKANNDYAELGETILSTCIDKVNDGFAVATFCSGLAGMCWTIEHLHENDMVEIDNDEMLSQMDEYINTMMKGAIQQGNYDFLHGAIGCAFYFLKRFKNTQSEELKTRYKSYLDQFLTLLEACAVKEGNTIKWKSLLDLSTGDKGYNLSLSHGISSIVNILSRMHEHEAFKLQTEPLIEQSINFIFENEIKSGRENLLFSNWVTEENKYHNKCRLAWCYGDLGTGMTLLRAAQALGDTQLYQKAVDTLKFASQLKTKEETLVLDASICHGAYGNALVFKKIYGLTKEPTFKEAADYWLTKGLKMATFSDGFAGYKQFEKGNKWHNRLPILEGVSGIGLVILDFLSTEKLSWDECLLIS